MTYPQVTAWLQQKHAKKVIPHYKIQQSGELPLCQCGDVLAMRVSRCEKNLFTPQPCHRKYQCLYSLSRKGALLHVSKVQLIFYNSCTFCNNYLNSHRTLLSLFKLILLFIIIILILFLAIAQYMYYSHYSLIFMYNLCEQLHTAVSGNKSPLKFYDINLPRYINLNCTSQCKVLLPDASS